LGIQLKGLTLGVGGFELDFEYNGQEIQITEVIGLSPGEASDLKAIQNALAEQQAYENGSSEGPDLEAVDEALIEMITDNSAFSGSAYQMQPNDWLLGSLFGPGS
jgi:hypothetical protein